MKFDSVGNIEKFRIKLSKSAEWHNLDDKTQVFNERKTDVKSRGSHCVDVGDVSEKLVGGLGGDDVQIVKAYLTGLIHDLGHIPYGHAGEAVADDIIQKTELSDEEKANLTTIREILFGKKYSEINSKPCFEHNENSVIQYVLLCARFGFEPDREIMDGILSHSTSRVSELPKSLVQQAVRLADKLAYINYDLEDLINSFKDKPEEYDAVMKLYQPPLLDPEGKEVKIPLADGRQLTIAEFIKLPVKERVDILIAASIEEAKARAVNPPDEYKGFDTILTGGNDIMVELSRYKKMCDKGKISKDEFEKIKKQLMTELYKRSPIMYAAYEIKDRSDAFIRAGVGLTKKTQEERTFNAQSAVGNEDIKNEYYYKSLVTSIRNIIKENKKVEELAEPLRTLFSEYLKFKEEQDSALKSLPGNTDYVTLPEIFTIVNFIGIHSNTQLNDLAEELGIKAQYEKEVLPLIHAIQVNSEFYDKDNGVLTKEGRKARESLVSKYGAKIHFAYSLEEEGVVPTISEEVVELLEAQGYEVGDRSSSKSKEERLTEFRTAAKKSEQAYIDALIKTIQETRNQAAANAKSGRSI